MADASLTPTPDEAPVTVWLRQLESGDGWAAQALYVHFCGRLHNLARRRLPTGVRRGYDEDDVAVSAFHSLFRGVREQRFDLRSRTDFWRLLLLIAERKIAHRIRHELSDKRDILRLAENSIFRQPTGMPLGLPAGVDSLECREPTPEFAAEVADTCDALLAALPDDLSRNIALMKLENYAAEEIAASLGCTRRTVQRKLLVIRCTWQHIGGINVADESRDVSPSDE